jgi:hypothetical protein
VVELVDTGDLKFHLYVLPCSIQYCFSGLIRFTSYLLTDTKVAQKVAQPGEGGGPSILAGKTWTR